MLTCLFSSWTEHRCMQIINTAPPHPTRVLFKAITITTYTSQVNERRPMLAKEQTLMFAFLLHVLVADCSEKTIRIKLGSVKHDPKPVLVEKSELQHCSMSQLCVNSEYALSSGPSSRGALSQCASSRIKSFLGRYLKFAPKTSGPNSPSACPDYRYAMQQVFS